jgi:uncharacterized protein
MRRVQMSPVDESLLEAVSDGDKEQVTLIIDNYGGDVNALNQYGASPALLAAKRNDLKMLILLVERGANVVLSDGLNQSPLYWAKHHKNQNMIDFIDNQSAYNSYKMKI